MARRKSQKLPNGVPIPPADGVQRGKSRRKGRHGKRPARTCNGKRRYRDRSEALNTLHRVQSRSARDVLPERPYWCADCRGWHLTSKPKRGG